ncbi:MAG: phosphotransferase [Holosporaceae bacterium]|nr:MAG: phosphotransferase [Holosporaceae bacterium]
MPFPFAKTQKERTIRQKKKADAAYAAYPKAYEKLYNHYDENAPGWPGCRLVFGHGDLNLTNMLMTKAGDIYFIDWPNASMENRFIELGALTFWAGMDTASTKKFLTHYFGAEPTKEQLKDLSWGQRRAAFYVATMWLRFVDPGAYEYTLPSRQSEMDDRFNSVLRDIHDYHKKGKWCPLQMLPKASALPSF